MEVENDSPFELICSRVETLDLTSQKLLDLSTVLGAPKYKQRLQYSGYKKAHLIKYQCSLSKWITWTLGRPIQWSSSRRCHPPAQQN